MRHQAFSLLELMISLSILSLISLTTLHHYQEKFVHLRRLDAEIALFDLAQKMELFFKEHNTYQGSESDSDFLALIPTLKDYEFLIIEANDSGYLLEAKALNEQARRDRNCPVLRLHSNGLQELSTTADQTPNSLRPDCWS